MLQLCNLGFTICGSYIEQVWPPLLYASFTLFCVHVPVLQYIFFANGYRANRV